MAMTPRKVLTLAELAAQRDALAGAGGRLVLTNGCFDLLHVGHVRYLQAARAAGDALAVALNGDESVRALKGPGRPLNCAADRAEILAALACVDYVTVFEEPRATGVFAAVRPHIYVKGADYRLETLDPGERAALEAGGAEFRFVTFVPGRSTTNLVEKMKDEGKSVKGPLRIAVLGSGAGSNFRAIAEAIQGGQLDAQVALVVSDVPGAGILRLAMEYQSQTLCLPVSKFKSKLEPEIEADLAAELQERKVDLVVLAGFMRLLKEPLLAAFSRRIINIHPSLLPKFPGLEAWRQALEAGETEAGCTVHYVDRGMDTGEIIAQERVPILPGDTAAALHARIQAAEHRLYPRVIGDFAAGRRHE